MLTAGPAVRGAVPDDAPDLARCHMACWREAYRPLLSGELLDGLDVREFQVRWEQRLADPHSGVVVGVVDQELVGFASSGPSRDEPPVRELELFALYTRAANHGSGLGQALLEALLGGGPCSLWVARDNVRARAFYRRNGFLPDGGRRVDADLEDLVEVRLVR